MKQKEQLLVLNINEFNYKFLKKKSIKFGNKNLINFFRNFKRSLIFTDDKIQHKNLDPWVQEVSINTGINSKKHKINNLGEKLNNKIPQIWDLIAKKNTVSIWGSMNSQLRDHKNIKIFFPDPWNFTSKIKPKYLESIFCLPNYYAKNYTKIKAQKFIFYSLIMLKSLIFNKSILKHFLFNFVFYLKNFFLSNLPINFKLFVLFDIISLLILKDLLNKNKSSCLFIFLNSIAHFQHNYWDDEKNYKKYFVFFDKLFFLLNDFIDSFNSTIVYNGFSQKKIKTEYLLKPIQSENFLKKINIKFKKSEQNMTNGAILFFKNKKETLSNYNKMKNFIIGNLYLFELNKINDTSFFYKIRIKANNIRYKDFSFQKNFRYYKKFRKSKKFQSNLYLIDEFKFIKTTGVHVSEGEFLYKNLNLKLKRKFYNHLIFKIIKKILNV
tara:strand:+ start:2568 stop:3881 length:1314 start_codon:yes stop_codon:yes gene_type:complete